VGDVVSDTSGSAVGGMVSKWSNRAAGGGVVGGVVGGVEDKSGGTRPFGAALPDPSPAATSAPINGLTDGAEWESEGGRSDDALSDSSSSLDS
jgi:hypothetical protein